MDFDRREHVGHVVGVQERVRASRATLIGR